MASVDDILTAARFHLVDTEKVHWTDPELITFLNEGIITALIEKPDLLAVVEPLACAAGAKQSLPAETMSFFGVTRNLGGTGAAITYVKRSVLDAEDPQWYSAAEAAQAEHYTYDEQQEKVFYLYPPVLVGTSIEVHLTKRPTPVAAGQEIPLPLEYKEALTDYVVYRAYLKDSDYGTSADNAERYLRRFQSALGIKTQNEYGRRPKVAYNTAPAPEIS